MNKHMKYVVLTSLMAPMATNMAINHAAAAEGDNDAKKALKNLQTSCNAALTYMDAHSMTNAKLMKAAIQQIHNNANTIDFIYDISTIGSNMTNPDEAEENLLEAINRFNEGKCKDDDIDFFLQALTNILKDDAVDLSDENSKLRTRQYIARLLDGWKPNGNENSLIKYDEDLNNIPASTLTGVTAITQSIPAEMQEYFRVPFTIDYNTIDQDAKNIYDSKLENLQQTELIIESKTPIEPIHAAGENDDDSINNGTYDLRIKEGTKLKSFDIAELITEYEQSTKDPLTIYDNLPYKYNNALKVYLGNKIDDNTLYTNTLAIFRQASADCKTQERDKYKDASSLGFATLNNLAKTLGFQYTFQNTQETTNALKGVTLDDNITQKELLEKAAQAIDKNLDVKALWGTKLEDQQITELQKLIQTDNSDPLLQELNKVISNKDRLYNPSIKDKHNDALLIEITEQALCPGNTAMARIVWKMSQHFTQKLNDLEQNIVAQLETEKNDLQDQINNLTNQLKQKDDLIVQEQDLIKGLKAYTDKATNDLNDLHSSILKTLDKFIKIAPNQAQAAALKERINEIKDNPTEIRNFLTTTLADKTQMLNLGWVSSDDKDVNITNEKKRAQAKSQPKKKQSTTNKFKPKKTTNIPTVTINEDLLKAITNSELIPAATIKINKIPSTKQSTQQTLSNSDDLGNTGGQNPFSGGKPGTQQGGTINRGVKPGKGTQTSTHNTGGQGLGESGSNTDGLGGNGDVNQQELDLEHATISQPLPTVTKEQLAQLRTSLRYYINAIQKVKKNMTDLLPTLGKDTNLASNTIDYKLINAANQYRKQEIKNKTKKTNLSDQDIDAILRANGIIA